MKRIASLIAVLALTVALAQAQTVRSTAPAAGQIPGTVTNDNACAGCVGEYIVASNAAQGTLTTTITIASPGVLTTSGHLYTGINALVLATGGALPTGLTAGTTYYTLATTAPGAAYSLATTVDNAIAGTAINTSGTQSGTHTSTTNVSLTTATPINVAGIQLTAGDWDITLVGEIFVGSTTVSTATNLSISATSATIGSAPGSISRLVPFTGSAVTMTMGPAGPYRVSISGTTTYYAVVSPTFTVSNMIYGGRTALRARRVR